MGLLFPYELWAGAIGDGIDQSSLLFCSDEAMDKGELLTCPRDNEQQNLHQESQ